MNRVTKKKKKRLKTKRPAGKFSVSRMWAGMRIPFPATRTKYYTSVDYFSLKISCRVCTGMPAGYVSRLCIHLCIGFGRLYVDTVLLYANNVCTFLICLFCTRATYTGLLRNICLGLILISYIIRIAHV